MPSNYTRFSEITTNDCKDYLRLVEITTAEETLLGTMLEAAKNHALAFTGLESTYQSTPEKVDAMPEMTIAVYALVQDMFDKRTYTLDKDTVNKVIEAILGSRSINLL